MHSVVSMVREILYVHICNVRIHFIMYLPFGYFRVVVYVNVRPCLCRQNHMCVKHAMFCLYRFVCVHGTQPNSCVTIYRGTFKTKLELDLSIRLLMSYIYIYIYIYIWSSYS